MIQQLRALLGLDDSDGESSDEPDEEDIEEEPEEPEDGPTRYADEVKVDELEDDLKSLQSQVSDLDNDTETHDNRIQSMESDMGNMQDDLEEVESNIRDLLGIYDALSARVNPLVEGDVDSMPTLSNSDAGTAPDSQFDLTEEDAAPATDNSAGAQSQSDNARTLSDLKEDTGAKEDTVESETPGDDHHHVRSFSGTYASEVVAYEWLSMLLGLSGTAGTLRALSYYHDIGWISADVKKALQRRLAGADDDGDARHHRRLRADDHAESLSYVITLENLEQDQH